MPPARTFRPLVALIAAACLAAAGCNSPTGTSPGGTGTKKKVTTDKADASTDKANDAQVVAPTVAADYFGRVLGLDGKPAVGVQVRALIIANHGGSLVTDNGAGLLTDNGAGIIASNGASIIASNGAGIIASNSAGVIANAGGAVVSKYGLAQAAAAADPSATTNAKGEFVLKIPDGQTANIEAALGDDVKAIRGGVTAASRGVDLQLAYTGAIQGQVTAPPDRKITDFIGVDVFIPGTSYAAKADKDGNFTITNVPIGKYKLYATKVGLGQATSAAIEVKSKATISVGEIQLALEPLKITSVEPATAIEGELVTITGEHFGKSKGTPFQVFVGTSVIPGATCESDTVIRFTVPPNIASGNVVVTVGGLPSDAKPLQIAKGFSVLVPRIGIAVDKTVRLDVKAEGATGETVTAPRLAWTVADGGEIAVVDATGQITPKKAGFVTLRAAAGALVAEFRLRVGPPPAAGAALGGQVSDLIGSLSGLSFDATGTMVLSNVGNLLSLPAGGGALTLLAGDPASKDGAESESLVGDGTGADASFFSLTDVVGGPDGRYYGFDGSAIRVVSATGIVTTVAGGVSTSGQARDGIGLAAQLGFPEYPVFAGDKLYFVDDLAVRSYDPVTDEVKTIAKATETNVTGLASGPDGKLYALMDGKVHVLNGTTLSLLALGEEEDELAAPEAENEAEAAEDPVEEEPPLDEDPLGFDNELTYLARGSDGVFYSTMGSAIVTIKDGKASTIAGGASDAPRDGTGLSARFSDVLGGLVIGPAGQLYVLDDSAVRKIDLKAGGYPVTTVLRSGSDMLAVNAKRPTLK